MSQQLPDSSVAYSQTSKSIPILREKYYVSFFNVIGNFKTNDMIKNQYSGIIEENDIFIFKDTFKNI